MTVLSKIYLTFKGAPFGWDTQPTGAFNKLADIYCIAALFVNACGLVFYTLFLPSPSAYLFRRRSPHCKTATGFAEWMSDCKYLPNGEYAS